MYVINDYVLPIPNGGEHPRKKCKTYWNPQEEAYIDEDSRWKLDL